MILNLFQTYILASDAAVQSARIEARKAVQQVAIETAEKSVREKLLSMASNGEIKLSPSWRPTSLVSVIAKRSDLSDMEKIRLAARAKMEGNLGDLLPKKFSSSRDTNCKIPLRGTLKFEMVDKTNVEINEQELSKQKWSTAVFTDLADERLKKENTNTKDNINSLKNRFERAGQKN